MKENSLNLNEVLDRASEQLITTYRDYLVKENINATGNLSNSLVGETTEQNDNWSVWLSLADYWEYIENGRLSGKQPPVNSIERWLTNKKILPTQRNLSWAIAKSIAKKGIPGKHILERSLIEVDKTLDTEIDKQLNKQIDNIWI